MDISSHRQTYTMEPFRLMKTVYRLRRRCRCATYGIFIFVVFALFVFVSIPVPNKDDYTRLHDVNCEPSTQPFSPIIHQIWLNYSAFPTEWEGMIRSCRELNPASKYMLWSAVAIETFLETEYPWILDTYHSYPYNVQRVDAARLFILHHYGGVYLDMDIQCVHAFQDITPGINQYDVALGRGATFGVSNHVMMAKPHHPYITQAIKALPDYNRWFLTPYITIMYSAGPLFLTIMLENYACPEQIFVFPPEPEHNAYYVNQHGGSWHTWDTRIIDMLGAVHRLINHVLSLKTLLLLVIVAGGAIYRHRRKLHERKMQVV